MTETKLVNAKKLLSTAVERLAGYGITGNTTIGIIECLLELAPDESTIPGWTPCAEGQDLPTEKGVYNVTALISRWFRKETVSAPASYDPEREDCSWDILNVPEDYDYYFVLAWQPLPEPYNPDHNANGKAEKA